MHQNNSLIFLFSCFFLYKETIKKIIYINKKIPLSPEKSKNRKSATTVISKSKPCFYCILDRNEVFYICLTVGFSHHLDGTSNFNY